MKKIKISAVSYLNTKPFLYGLERSALYEHIDLSLDIPSVCAQKLIAGQADLGLVPVAVIPLVQNAKIITNFCIGADAAVRTVAIFADCPIEEITELYLDYQSRTSVELAKYLLKTYWKTLPKLIKAEQGFEDKIQGKTGAVVIGDRAIALEKKHRYIYDLSYYWKLQTGLPFVFAAWVSRIPLAPETEQALNQALALGLANVGEVARAQQPAYPHFSVYDYYTKNIEYQLDTEKRKALNYFLEVIKP